MKISWAERIAIGCIWLAISVGIGAMVFLIVKDDSPPTPHPCHNAVQLGSELTRIQDEVIAIAGRFTYAVDRHLGYGTGAADFIFDDVKRRLQEQQDLHLDYTKLAKDRARYDKLVEACLQRPAVGA